MARDVHQLLRPRQRRYGFPLTPLADAMFQLLIFFMLSSSLSPYSLMTLRAGPGLPGGGPSAEATGAQTTGAAPVIWTVEQGEVLTSGQRFGFDRLPQLSAALRDAGDPPVVLITSTRALVQDLVRVLEALTAAGVADVQIIRQVAQ